MVIAGQSMVIARQLMMFGVAMSMFCLSLAWYLARVTGPVSLSLGDSKSLPLSTRGEKSSHWLKTKPSLGDTLGLQFRTRWVLVHWISEFKSFAQIIHELGKVIFGR